MQMLMKHGGGRLKIKSGRVSGSLSITCKRMANCPQEVNKTVRNKTQIRIVIINLLNLLGFF